MFLQWLYPPLPWGVALARASHLSRLVSKGADADAVVAIRFDFGADPEGSLSPAQREIFAAAFRRELASAKAWFTSRGWAPQSRADLQVAVSADYKISRALVPAWEGSRGRMEFPLWRVSTGKAAIAHELTHVFFPNGNRFLA